MTKKQTRRDFLLTSGAVAGSIVLTTTFEQTAKPTSAMLERVLGRTDVKLPICGLGGAGQTPLSWDDRERDAVAIIQKAWQLGIRYFDTAASYGPSEDYLGKVLPPHRSKLFLASKTDKRDRDGAWRELERSLNRLNTDYLDLWQLHHVSFAQELDTIFSASSGAIQAVEEAIQQKLVRFAGITGHHDPQIIAEGLRRYPFHTTLIPVNAADKHHPHPFLPVVMPVAQEKNVGVIAMKVPAYGRLFKPGGLNMQQAFGYAMSQPGVHCCVIAAETTSQLEDNVKIARAFQPLAEQELTAISQRTANIWEDSTFFRAWT